MDTWYRLVRWCEENAPDTFRAIRPPAGHDVLETAQRRTGGWPWPDDVIGFFTRCDGLVRSPAGYLLPGYRPLSLTEVVAEWENQVDRIAAAVSTARISEFPDPETFYAQVAADSHAHYQTEGISAAGLPAGRFITPWLPVAEDQSGSVLVVDRRRGERHGCATAVDKVDADFNARSWPSLSSLLAAVAAALDSGTVVEGSRYRPVTRGGELAWVRG